MVELVKLQLNFPVFMNSRIDIWFCTYQKAFTGSEQLMFALDNKALKSRSNIRILHSVDNYGRVLFIM